MSGYIGVQPVPKATQRREYFTATNGQTSFSTSGYTPEYIDVYMNGVKLSPADFTATNGSDVVLGSGAATGDLLQIISFLPFSVLNQAFSGTLSVAGALTAASGTLSGALGLGESNPLDMLSISSATGDAAIRLKRTDTAIVNDDIYGVINFAGDDSDTNASGIRGFIRGKAQGTGGGMKMEFHTAGGGAALVSEPRMTLNADGQLGIGGTPTELLEIAGSSDPTLLIRHNTADNASSGKISFRENAGGSTGVDLRYDGAANKFIIDTSDVSNAFVINRTNGAATFSGTVTSTGLIGNATNFDIMQNTSDGSDNKRTRIGGGGDVISSRGALVEVSGNEHGNGGMLALQAGHGGNNSQIRSYTAGQERTRLDASGNLGIGTTSTSSIRLQAVTPTANHVGLQVENSNTADSFGMVVKGGNDANDYTADFRKRDNTNIMRIRGDGNVGIGTTSPSAPIDVVTNSTVYAAEFTQSNTSNGDGVFISVGSTAATDYVLTCRSNAGAVSALAVKADGKVGIGTFSPACHLSIQGPTSDSGKITEFYGSRQNGSLQVTNYLTGSDNDRVGLYWRNSGIVNTRMWCDDTMDIRVHSGDPSSDTDGTVVGTQTFSGTHIYKTDATDLVVGQAVRLVGRKLVKTTSANDKLCVGIYAGQSGKVVDSFGQACNETDGYGHAVIALGDTRMKQSGTTTIGVLVDGSVEAGDLLCTSGTAGKLTVQADDIIRSYTVGKAIEDGNASAPVYAYIYCG